MKNIKFAVILAASLFLVGCATTNVKSEMTPLEIQALQTREYETTKSIVFPSVISVFQDLGYTIDNANIATGLIKAESATQNSAALTFWTGMAQNTQTAATAFIEEIGGTTKVRLNFVTKTKTSTAYGREDQRDTPILSAEVYQNAFERVESAIFIRSPN